MSDQNREIESLKQVLRELSDLAEGASLTGSMRGGEARAVARYNSLLQRLIELGAVSSMFQALPTESSFGELAVEARLLSASLTPNREEKHKQKGDASILMRLAPFVDSHDLAELIREQVRQNANIDMDQIANLAPFLDSSILGELMRAQMPKAPPAAPPQPAPAPQPEARPQAQTHLPVAGEQPERAEDIVALLKNPHLSESERAELVQRLTALVS